jgi:hypothetical protein
MLKLRYQELAQCTTWIKGRTDTAFYPRILPSCHVCIIFISNYYYYNRYVDYFSNYLLPCLFIDYYALLFVYYFYY